MSCRGSDAAALIALVHWRWRIFSFFRGLSSTFFNQLQEFQLLACRIWGFENLNCTTSEDDLEELLIGSSVEQRLSSQKKAASKSTMDPICRINFLRQNNVELSSGNKSLEICYRLQRDCSMITGTSWTSWKGILRNLNWNSCLRGVNIFPLQPQLLVSKHSQRGIDSRVVCESFSLSSTPPLIFSSIDVLLTSSRVIPSMLRVKSVSQSRSPLTVMLVLTYARKFNLSCCLKYRWNKRRRKTLRSK